MELKYAIQKMHKIVKGNIRTKTYKEIKLLFLEIFSGILDENNMI